MTRERFLRVLSDIQHILIRATYNTKMQSATLRGLTMDTAVPQNTNRGRADIVEYCTCPPGYSGLSCQVKYINYEIEQVPPHFISA